MRYSTPDPYQPNTLNRRYELPTCLLEVWTERSPLSDWQAQFVAQNLRFQLRLSEERAQGQRVIQGNQQQISNLITAVTSYCDRWLAQDDVISLNHAIEIPQLAKLQLSTLQLFDLYESLERCADELVILPSLTLEMRRPHWNWLKIIAGAIALMGVSLGAIRLISNPFGEQPSYQVAVTASPNSPSSLENLSPERQGNSQTGSIPSQTPDRTVNSPQVAIAPKSSAPASAAPLTPSEQSPSKSQSSSSNQNQSPDQGLNKLAAAPSPEPLSTVRSRPSSSPQESSKDAQINQNASQPSTFGASAKPSSRNNDRGDRSFDNSFSTGAAESSPTPETTARSVVPMLPPSPSLSPPSALPQASQQASQATASMQVLKLRSDLPSDLTNDLVRYIQGQKLLTSAAGILIIDIEVNQSQVNITNDLANSTFSDHLAIDDLTQKIRTRINQLRSANQATGKASLVIQISK